MVGRGLPWTTVTLSRSTFDRWSRESKACTSTVYVASVVVGITASPEMAPVVWPGGFVTGSATWLTCAPPPSKTVTTTPATSASGSATTSPNWTASAPPPPFRTTDLDQSWRSAITGALPGPDGPDRFDDDPP